MMTIGQLRSSILASFTLGAVLLVMLSGCGPGRGQRRDERGNAGNGAA